MRRRTLSSSISVALRTLGLACAALSGPACNEPFDTTRPAGPKVSLGDDIYGVLCDRVGASSLTADLSGESFQRVCHPNADGVYEDRVDTSFLPPVSEPRAVEARRLAIAKVEAVARRRGDLIRALDGAFADIEINDVTSADPNATIRLHDALLEMSHTMSALYRQNPFNPGGEPVFPTSTRALGRLLDGLASNDAATSALSSIWGRDGYRPSDIALGTIRTALGYPDLRGLGRSALEVLGPGGAGAPPLAALLRIGKQEMLTFKATQSSLPPVAVDPATAQPSRPRSALELGTALLLAEDAGFAETDTATPTYVARRDKRGFALTSMSAPFADGDGDGLADVDAFGRFIDGSGAPLSIDPPFAVAGLSSGPPDEFGRPAASLYRYLDTSRTLVASTMRLITPLIDPTRSAPEGDARPWNSEHEGLMYTMAGAPLALGDREDAVFDAETESVRPAGEACPHCVPYHRFRGEDSPLTMLGHALGQLLADPESDALLLSVMDLLQNHEDVVARFVAAALHAREIALAHDKLAEQGREPVAGVPYETPVWDEMAALMDKVVSQPGLMTKLVETFASDSVLTPRGSAQNMGDAIAKLMLTRDVLQYDPDDVNGATVNTTLGAQSTADPETPVDQTQPKVGQNRSNMQRLLQGIDDANRVTLCNKAHAKVNMSGLQIGDYGECSLIKINNVAAFFLNANLPANHPKRSNLQLNDAGLNILIGLAQIFGVSPDSLFQSASGLTGLTLHPTIPALNRLANFGADSSTFPGMPDLDPYRTGKNQGTNGFISSMFEPTPSKLCPKNAAGANQCASMDQTMRGRDASSLLLMERFGFLDYIAPVGEVFAESSTDLSGEEILLDLIGVLNRHWVGSEHGAECSKEGTAETNPGYCSEAGLGTYEAITADVLQSTDLLPALVAFSQVAKQSARVTVQRGPDAGRTLTGTEVLEKLAKMLFSKQYAASVGMVDHKGNKTATWTDGRPQDQVTLFTLLGDALHQIDAQFDKSTAPDAQDRKSQWKRGRSELVDAFLTVEGSGNDAHFKNRALPKVALTALQLLREQLNANCPDRESTGACDWARSQFGRKIADLVSHPFTAGLVDVMDALRASEPARRSLEAFLSYMLSSSSPDASFAALLASATDFMQVLANDELLAPILQASSAAANDEADPEGAGAADAGLKALKALLDDRFDRYHVIDPVLKGLVTPLDDGRAPIQIFLDVITDVNRIDSTSAEPLSPVDYKQIFMSTRDFMIDRTRGLEQLYFIVQHQSDE